MRLIDGHNLTSRITSCSVVHIFGAGLNQDRPAHTAVKELSDRGWAIAPIHPRDGGATIDGFPIRPELDEGVTPEIVVLFLAPERARAVVRNLIIRLDKDEFPLIWFQLGAEDEQAIEALEEMGVDYVFDDCLVRYCNRHDIDCSESILPQNWCLQTASEDGDGCSIWSVYSSDSTTLGRPLEALEWVGSLADLASSQATIPRYIRSLRQENESLLTLANKLAN